MQAITYLLVLSTVILGNFSFSAAQSTSDYTPRNYYAVIVGISDYPGTVNDLAYSDLDAIAVRDALAAYPQWSDENVLLLLNSSATKEAIGQAIAQIGSRAAADDAVLFYYSGHGSTLFDMPPGDERDFQDETLFAYDLDIRDDELSAWLKNLNTTNVIVILDSCHSGGQIKSPVLPGLRAKAWPRTAGPLLEGDGFDADIKNAFPQAKDLGTNPGCIIVTACRADQSSYESDIARHGLFSFFFLLVINDFYDLNANGQLSAEEIGLSVMWSFWNLYSTYPSLYVIMPQIPQFYDDYPSGASAVAELPVCWP